MTLEKRIESICQHMPEGWDVRIELEQGAANVIAVRPDGYEVNMGNGDDDLEGQIHDAYRLAIDEIMAGEIPDTWSLSDKQISELPILSLPNVKDEPRGPNN